MLTVLEDSITLLSLGTLKMTRRYYNGPLVNRSLTAGAVQPRDIQAAPEKAERPFPGLPERASDLLNCLGTQWS